MSDHDRDRLARRLAEELVITEAEYAAAGLRRLTVLHDLADDQDVERAELLAFVDDVCRAHKIKPVGGVASGQRPVGDHPRDTRWTRWLFAPPNAAADLATVRAALQERSPNWPIEAEGH